MNRRLVSGAMAALAAIVLAVGGGTLAAFDDAADVPHSTAGAGVLQLDLGTAGTAGAPLEFAGLEPGLRTSRLLWVAANDRGSTTPARLSVTLHHLVDVAAPCNTSMDKALGDIASGIDGCAVTPNGVSGTPSRGVVSRLLDVSARYDPAAGGPGSCSATVATGAASLLPKSGPGDLYGAATADGGAGTATLIVDAHGDPLTLAPGDGLCIAVSAYWPPNVTVPARASPDHPVDNAAQGDSFSVEVRFDLVQAAP